METIGSPGKPGISVARDPDADAIDLVRSGGVARATHKLVKRHSAAIYRYCRNALGNATLADDVHQIVFIEAFRDLPRFAGRSTVRSWLFAIARHRVLDAVKRCRRAGAYIDDVCASEMPDPRPLPGESVDRARLHAALIASLEKLEAPTRTAILLHYQQGLTFEEMASICNEKASTLHARVARALPRIRTAMRSRLRARGDGHVTNHAAV